MEIRKQESEEAGQGKGKNWRAGSGGSWNGLNLLVALLYCVNRHLHLGVSMKRIDKFSSPGQSGEE